MWDEQRDLDCLKRERDMCVKNVIHSQNTAFMFTPALTHCLSLCKAERKDQYIIYELQPLPWPRKVKVRLHEIENNKIKSKTLSITGT